MSATSQCRGETNTITIKRTLAITKVFMLDGGDGGDDNDNNLHDKKKLPVLLMMISIIMATAKA